MQMLDQNRRACDDNGLAAMLRQCAHNAVSRAIRTKTAALSIRARNARHIAEVLVDPVCRDFSCHVAVFKLIKAYINGAVLAFRVNMDYGIPASIRVSRLA